MHRTSLCCTAAIALAAVSFTTDVRAQYASGFQNLTLTPTGAFPFAPAMWDASAPNFTPGQDGYYRPVTTSVPFHAQAYTGGAQVAGVNDFGVADNPNGGAQFIVGNGPGGSTFARSQRDMTYSSTSGIITWATDICCLFVGTLPTAQNLGSFSVQPYPATGFIMLARWTDVNTAANWNADMVWSDGTGLSLTESIADPAFQNLMVNHWYRWEIDASLLTNQILAVRIIDLSTNTTASHSPADRWGVGGSTGTMAPTGLRFFAGGGAAGNVIAYDNVTVGQPATATASGAGCLGMTLVSNNAGPKLGNAWDLTFGPSGNLFTTDIVTVVLKLGPSLPGVPFPVTSYGGCMNYMGLGPFIVLPVQTGVTVADFTVDFPAASAFFGINLAAQGVGFDVPAALFFTTNVQDATTGS